MPEIKKLRCVVCPIGCSIEATLDDQGNVLNVTGNTCPRGKNYAMSELTHPVRTLTSTVFSEDGQKVPVRTSSPLSKEKMFEAMDVIHKTKIKLPAHRGDVIFDPFIEEGVQLIVTKDMFPKR